MLGAQGKWAPRYFITICHLKPLWPQTGFDSSHAKREHRSSRSELKSHTNARRVARSKYKCLNATLRKVLNAWNEFRLDRKCSQLPHKALFIFSYEGSLPRYPSLAKTWRSLGQFPITTAASQLITIVVNTLTLESDKMPRCQPVCRMQPQQCESSNTPVFSGSNLAVWGGCQDNTRRGARGMVCQSQQVAMANSSSESRSVFPAVKTASGGGSQCCPCYPMYRHCYKWHQSRCTFLIGLVSQVAVLPESSMLQAKRMLYHLTYIWSQGITFLKITSWRHNNNDIWYSYSTIP